MKHNISVGSIADSAVLTCIPTDGCPSLLELARIKGTLDATELTYMHSAAKIMDKLKGGYE